MNVALVGLPLSGKTCVFDAITEGAVDSASNPARADRPNAAQAAIPDERLDWLSAHYATQKRTPIQMEWVDLPGLTPGRSDLAAQNTAIMESLRRADALVIVLRAFENPSAPHPRGRVDARADLATLHAEFLISDLDVALRRIEKLEKSVLKPSADREANKKELEILERCRVALEAEKPVHTVMQNDREKAIIRGFCFLTEKPSVIILNVGEEAAANPEAATEAYKDLGVPAFAMCASLEAEISKLPAADRPEFMKEMGLARLHGGDILKGVYAALGRILYFTAGEKEVAARSIPAGSNACEAAGAVHTDMAKGFIRAEVVAYEDFKRAGGLKEARTAGTLHLEGRDYIVKDGDVMLFHFSR